MRSKRFAGMMAGFALASSAAIAGCGGGGSYGGSGGTTPPTTTNNPPTTNTPPTTTNAPPAAGFAITISGLAYSPLDLKVPPGATITVTNNDGMPHSVTSEARSGAFTPGAVSGVQFDTGEFSSGQRTITIPSNAPAGTVIPYYCTIHRQTMATPNGTITVDPAAQPAATPAPAPAPATGGMGY